MKKILSNIFFIALLIMFGCNNYSEKTNLDKIEIINIILKDKKFYDNISPVIRNQSPYIIESDLLRKEDINKLVYLSKSVKYAKVDSLSKEFVNKNWRTPSFFIEFNLITKQDNKISISALIRSIGINAIYVIDIKSGKILKSDFLEIKI